MAIDPRIVATIFNVVALLGVLGLTAWLGLTILRGRTRWPKLLLPILALVFTFAAMALVTFPFSFGASTESQVQQTIEVDR
jgi:cytochrome c oxidase assembly factor CtaG